MSEIRHQNPANAEAMVDTGKELKDHTGNRFPLVNGAFRMVAAVNYTHNFGFQWNKFVETQIDKSTSIKLSYDRFFNQTQWDKENLLNKNVLEVGSGAGRFTQIVLDHTQANLYSVDYSDAVTANFKNNGPNSRLHLYQASIYELPFAPAQFDKVFCFGVLQHTPDVEKSVSCLIEMAKPGAEVVVDFYPITGWWTKLHAKYLLRPFTRKMSNEQLYKLIDRHADWLIATNRFISKMGLGKLFNRFLPICDIDGTFPKGLSKEKLRELVLLDTFDMYSPEYDQPQRIRTVVKWFEKHGMKNVWGGMVTHDHFKAAVVKGIKAS